MEPEHPRQREKQPLRLRLFDSRLSRFERRLYGTVTVLFIGTFVATMWPVYPWFNRLRPFVLGMPMSLAWLLVLVFASFFALLGLYLWEARRGGLE